MATPTALSVFTDRSEYSRFESDRDTITVTVTPTGTSMSGEEILVYLVKARRARDIAVAYKTITLSSDNPHTTTFFLPELVGIENANRARRGKYFIKVVAVSDTDVFGESSDFKISLITVRTFKRNYLNGLDLAALNAYAPLSVKNQPVNVTGVVITEVSSGHPQKWVPLSYNYSVNGLDIVRTISWYGGPLTILSNTAGIGTYTLRGLGDCYVTIEVNFAALPTVTTSEDILIIRMPFDDQYLSEALEEAISWIEDVALTVYLEPTIAVTEIDTTSISYDAGTDIPTFNDADWDVTNQPMSYYKQAGLNYMDFRMPFYPVIKFFRLYGKIANTLIVDINSDWIQFHEKQGYVQLVPFNASTAYNYIGLLWNDTLRALVPIPNFWHFKALLGFRDTPKILLELLGKKAAIDVLLKLGQAFRTGIASQSISRDGVSESVSFISSNPLGVYGPVIKGYQDWIDNNLPSLRGIFRGPNLLVV